MSDQAPPISFEQQSTSITLTWFNKLSPVLSYALRLAAIPYWFDAPLLAALRGPDDGDGRTQRILDWLAQRSFVSRLPNDRYVLSADMRDFIRVRWTTDRAGFAEANRRLADYFSARIPTASGLEADELRQAYVYHLLGADGEAGIAALQKALDEAEFSHRLAVAEKLVAVASEQRLFLTESQSAWISYLETRSLQLHNRWAESCAKLQTLLQDLPGDTFASLRPRAQAALATGLVETQHWTAAIELYEQALAAFQAAGQTDEAAACQLGLGYAHMDLGLNVWGQRESRPLPLPSLRQTLLDLVTLPARLPVLLYIWLTVRDPAMLPGWLTLTRGVDWTIARMFVRAARWYRRALAQMEAAHKAEGILRAQDSLARLYLALGYPAGAAEIYREIIERPDIATSEYQTARARAGLGLCLLRNGQAAKAVQLLQATASVLADYGDSMYAGRIFGILAEAQLVTGATSDAIASYSTALGLMLAQDDLTRATDVAHTLEAFSAGALTTRESAPDQNEAQVRAQARQLAASVIKRRYQTRYSHPALNLFRQVSVALLAVMLFVTLYLATRTETVIEVGAGTALIAQALNEPSSSASPVITPSRAWQVTPQFRPNIAMGGALIGLVGYLVAYTVVGLYVLIRMSSRQLEQGQSQTVQLDADSLSCGPDRIAFSEATGLLRNDWIIRGHPLASYSRTSLFGPAGRGPLNKISDITITGQTAWYPALSHEIARRVMPSAPRVDLSTSLTGSPSGILLMGNAIYLALFVALGYLAPNALSTPIFFGHYALADLRVVIYLALLIPLVSWLVIAPMRARVFLNPRSRMPWALAGVGLGLACVSFINLGVYHASLGRPDVIISLLAVWLVWLAALAIWRARWHPVLGVESAGASAYPVLVRWGGLAVAIVILALAMPLMVNELLSYDALLSGNVARDRAARLALEQKTAESQALYADALAAYDRALKYNPRDATAITGRGAIYSQKGEWDKAILSYQASLAINPRQPTVWSNLGLAYEGNASALDNLLVLQTAPDVQQTLQQQQAQAFKNAIGAYTRAIELQSRNAKYVLRRGVVNSALGQLLLDEGQKSEARTLYSSAQNDFVQTLRLEPHNADAYDGLGWAYFKMAESYYDPDRKVYTDPAQAQAAFEKARDNFNQAVHWDPNNANVYNGLGWTWLKLGDLESLQGDRAAAQSSYEQVVEAYARASQLEPHNPQYAVSLGNARWLVSTNMVRCGNPSATDADLARYMNVIQAAITDVERGTELARAQNFTLDKNLGYYYRQLGQLAYILYTCQGQDPVARLEQAIAYYDKAIAADPSNPDYFQFRGRITFVLGLRQPQDPAGQQHRLEDYQRALADLSFSLTLSQTNHEALYWRGLVNTQLAGLQSTQDRDDLARREEYLTDALTDTQSALALAPNEATRGNYATALASIYLKLGWTYYLQDRYELAVEATDQGIQYNADQPLLYFVKGLAELVMGDSQAQPSYDAGIKAAQRLDDVARRSVTLNEGIQDLHDLLDKKPKFKDAAEPILRALQAAKP